MLRTKTIWLFPRVELANSGGLQLSKNSGATLCAKVGSSQTSPQFMPTAVERELGNDALSWLRVPPPWVRVYAVQNLISWFVHLLSYCALTTAQRGTLSVLFVAWLSGADRNRQNSIEMRRRFPSHQRNLVFLYASPAKAYVYCIYVHCGHIPDISFLLLRN